MKNILIKLSSLLLLIGVLTSCEEDKVVYSGGDIIMFDGASSSYSVVEDAGQATLLILLSKKYSSDVTVNFEVTDGTAIQGTHYSISGTSVVIPAGETSGSILINLVNDDEGNAPRTFTVKLLSSSIDGATIGLGGDEGTYLKTVVIANDDCPSKAFLWYGNLSLLDVGFGSVPGSGSSNANGDCDIIVIQGDVAGGGMTPAEGTIFYLTPDFPGATTGTVEVPAQTYCVNCSEGFDAKFSGSGTYDEATKTILVDYSLDRTDGGHFWTGQLEITVVE
jgi:hypothetical protein